MLIEGESVDLDADEGDTGKVVGRLFDLSNPLEFAFDDLIRLLGVAEENLVSSSDHEVQHSWVGIPKRESAGSRGALAPA